VAILIIRHKIIEQAEEGVHKENSDEDEWPMVHATA